MSKLYPLPLVYFNEIASCDKHAVAGNYDFYRTLRCFLLFVKTKAKVYLNYLNKVNENYLSRF